MIPESNEVRIIKTFGAWLTYNFTGAADKKTSQELFDMVMKERHQALRDFAEKVKMRLLEDHESDGKWSDPHYTLTLIDQLLETELGGKE